MLRALALAAPTDTAVLAWDAWAVLAGLMAARVAQAGAGLVGPALADEAGCSGAWDSGGLISPRRSAIK